MLSHPWWPFGCCPRLLVVFAVSAFHIVWCQAILQNLQSFCNFPRSPKPFFPFPLYIFILFLFILLLLFFFSCPIFIFFSLFQSIHFHRSKIKCDLMLKIKHHTPNGYIQKLFQIPLQNLFFSIVIQIYPVAELPYSHFMNSSAPNPPHPFHISVACRELSSTFLSYNYINFGHYLLLLFILSAQMPYQCSFFHPYIALLLVNKLL